MNDTNTGFPKYQYSLFLGQDRNAPQIVVRSNDFTEFKKMLEEIELIKLADRSRQEMKQSVDEAEGYTRERVKQPDDDDDVAICPLHNVQMKKREGQYGVFFSHYAKEQGFCNGKGYKK